MNWFDIIIIIVLIYCIISGYKSGLIKQLTALAGIIIAALLSGKISDSIYPYIKDFTEIPEYVKAPFSFIIAFLIILSLFYIIGGMLESIIKTLKMGTLNKLCGSIFCFAKWCFAISILLNVVTTLDDNNQLINPNIEKESKTFTYVQQLAPQIIPYLRFDKLKEHL